MSRSLAQRWCWLLGLLGCATCVSQPSVEQRERSSSASTPEPSASLAACEPVPSEALLILSEGARGCPIVLVPELSLATNAAGGEDETGDEGTEGTEADAPAEQPLGQRVALLQLPRVGEGEREQLGWGLAPLSCGAGLGGCDFDGIVHAGFGPIVIASERGYESEHPEQIHLGVLLEGRLAFVPTWASPSAVVDHTRVGPAYALAPWDCAGELSLLPAPRLPEAVNEDVPAELQRLAGRWQVDGETGRVEPPAQPRTSSEGCVPLLEPLP